MMTDADLADQKLFVVVMYDSLDSTHEAKWDLVPAGRQDIAEERAKRLRPHASLIDSMPLEHFLEMARSMEREPIRDAEQAYRELERERVSDDMEDRLQPHRAAENPTGPGLSPEDIARISAMTQCNEEDAPLIGDILLHEISGSSGVDTLADEELRRGCAIAVEVLPRYKQLLATRDAHPARPTPPIPMPAQLTRPNCDRER